MTGYHSQYWRHDCDQKGCYVQLLPSWDDIIDALPDTIRPTDVDGMVERNRHFLFIEEKSAGKSLDPGQLLALRRQAAQPNTTVVVIRPLLGGPTDMEAIWYPNPTGFQPITRQEFLGWIRDWGAYVSSTPARQWTYTT